MNVLKNNIWERKKTSKIIEAIKKLKKSNDIKKKSELNKVLSTIDVGVNIEYMLKWKVFSIKYEDDFHFYINGEESSKCTNRAIDEIFKEANNNPLNVEKAINNLSIDKQELMKEMFTEEIISKSEKIEFNIEIKPFNLLGIMKIYHKNPLEELDKKYNNFFWIWKWLVVNKERINKISRNTKEYWNILLNWEKEIWASFVTAKVWEYCHTFIKVDENNYECVFSYAPY